MSFRTFVQISLKCVLGASLLQAPTALAAGMACGGVTPIECPRGMFCKEPVGACGKARGHCMRKPEICNKIYLPVCGCNNKTYGNACEMEAAGVSELHSGKCRG